MDLNHRITGLQAVPLNSRARLPLNATIGDTLYAKQLKCNSNLHIFVFFLCLC